jgi:hypothetical protein
MLIVVLLSAVILNVVAYLSHDSGRAILTMNEISPVMAGLMKLNGGWPRRHDTQHSA